MSGVLRIEGERRVRWRCTMRRTSASRVKVACEVERGGTALEWGLRTGC